MKISILTPSYNSGKFIEKNILSVLNQDYKNVEHIINDNCSDDQSHSIFKKYKHLKISIEKDEGQSDALNKMINKSNGEIIGWLNADDFYQDNLFNLVINFFKDNPEIDAIYGNFNIVDDKNYYLRKVNALRFIQSFLPFICFIPSTTFFFRSDIINKYRISFEKKYFYMMDKDFFCKFSAQTKKIKKLNITIANFRVHTSSKTSFNLNKSLKDNFYYEGIDILRTYSNIKLKKNLLGIFIYKLITNFFRLMSFFIKRM